MKVDKKTWIYIVVFVVLTVLTVFFMTTQFKSFSITNFITILKTMDPFWIVMAFVAMVAFVFLEGCSFVIILRVFGYKRKLRKGWMYSAPDVFFSAITPSATGGQPATMFFMHKDGIPLAVSTLAIVVNLTFYASSILIIGILSLILNITMIGSFHWASLVLIAAGFLVQFIMMLVFILLVLKPNIIKGFVRMILKLLKKIHLVKKIDSKLAKLDKMEMQYKECASLIWKNKKKMLCAFLCNVSQRISLVLISVFVYFGVTHSVTHGADAFAAQGYALVGSNSVPIPGAIGAADLLFVDAYKGILNGIDPVSVELVSRGIAFYICVLLCALFSFIAYLVFSFKDKKRDNNGKEK